MKKPRPLSATSKQQLSVSEQLNVSCLKALVILAIDLTRTAQTHTCTFQSVSNESCRVAVELMVLQCYVKLIVIFASVQIFTQPQFVSTSRTVFAPLLLIAEITLLSCIVHSQLPKIGCLQCFESKK